MIPFGKGALNADPRTRFNTTLVPDPELQQTSYEACLRGELPEYPAVAMQIPTVMDPSVAPEGFHLATTYGFFFPCDAPREERGKLRDRDGGAHTRSLSEFLPDLRECIVERAVFSSITSRRCRAPPTRFTHGLIHPEQMIGGRLLVPGSAHATPFRSLSLRCHLPSRPGRDLCPATAPRTRGRSAGEAQLDGQPGSRQPAHVSAQIGR